MLYGANSGPSCVSRGRILASKTCVSPNLNAVTNQNWLPFPFFSARNALMPSKSHPCFGKRVARRRSICTSACRLRFVSLSLRLVRSSSQGGRPLPPGCHSESGRLDRSCALTRGYERAIETGVADSRDDSSCMAASGASAIGFGDCSDP